MSTPAKINYVKQFIHVNNFVIENIELLGIRRKGKRDHVKIYKVIFLTDRGTNIIKVRSDDSYDRIKNRFLAFLPTEEQLSLF